MTSVIEKPATRMERALTAHGSDVVGVDRENSIIRGYVVAELGPFKSPGRGEFDMAALEKIAELGNAKKLGVKSRFTHPDLSNDGLGTFLGRAKELRVDGTKVRADLHLDPTALDTPPKGGKPLGVYVMDLAESDPGALSSSIVVEADREWRLNADGTPKKDASGNRLPPLWRPKKLWASDVVDTGDAVDDFLSVDSLSDAVVRKTSAALDELFADHEPADIRTRLHAYVERYLSNRFGDDALETELLPPVMGDSQPSKESDMSDEVTKQLAALKAENESILAMLKSTNDALSAISSNLAEEREAAKKAAAAETRRAKIHQLCAMADCADDADKYVADESLSTTAVAELLMKQVCEKRKLSNGDGGGTDPGKESDDKYRREYRERQKLHSKLGVTEDEYVKQRRIEDGLDEQPDLLSLAAARAQNKQAG